MFKDASGSRKDLQRNAVQRNNRVFILEYSPERSKSNKKKQWEGSETRKEKLSSFLSRRDILQNDAHRAQQDTIHRAQQDTIHRTNIDRLTSLLSRARSSRQTGEGESGCEKLVKTIEKIRKVKTALVQAMDALKKYSMQCSSANYELFIQSKHHYNLKDKKEPEKPATQLPSIHERYSFDQGQQSHHSSHIKSPLQNEVSFRNKTESPLQHSILNSLESPMKCLQPSRISRDCIPTAQTLQSHPQLPNPLLAVVCSPIRSPMPPLSLVLQAPLKDRVGREEQFLHLCHLQTDVCGSSKPEEEDGLQQVKKLLISVSTQTGQKRQSPLGSFSKGRLDFALPTPISPQYQKININYPTYTALPEAKKSRKAQPALTANQIAQKMLFGRGEPVPEKVEPKGTTAVRAEGGEERGRKRVSSLPKITFTYTSRDKDLPLQSPSAKFIFLPASSKAVIKAVSPRKKEGLQSTFGSTQVCANSSNSRSGMKTRHPVQASRVVRVVRDQGSFNPFAGKHAAPLQRIERVDSEYYGGAVERQVEETRLLRPRIVTQAVANDNQIQFVGIEQQPRGCCWGKENRSKSLNERVLIGLRQQ